jgi:hypothetical protein
MKIIIFLFLFSFSTISSVQAITGNKLIKTCEKYNVEITNVDFQMTAYCTGYITGVVDGMNYIENRFCVPRKVIYGQIIKVVIKYLKNNPQRLHQDYAPLIYSAVSESFPCK